MKDRSKGRGAKWKVAVSAVCAVVVCAGGASAESPLAPPSDWWVLVEPKFMKPAVQLPVAGSERTVLVPGFTEGLDVKPMSAAQFAGLDLDWKRFAERASENADLFLKTLTPEYTRDSDKVIQFATISSDRPLVSSTVLAPGFRKIFEQTLGAEFYVVIPNRYLIYAFPKLASRYREYAPMVIDAYDATPYPVSMEVFEVTKEGVRAIGVYERP